MPEMTYASIKPLVSREEVQGGLMLCTFTCPVTGFSLDASAPIQKSQSAGSKVAARAKQSVKSGLLFQARNSLSRAIGGLLGYGMLGQVGRSAALSAASEATHAQGAAQVSFSDAEKQAAVVAAFESVSSRFMWDAKNERWVSAQLAGDLLTDFARQMEEAPITQTYDAGVLGRMLAEIANADGNIGEGEKSFLTCFAPFEAGSVDDLVNKPALSRVELDETAKGPSRDTMLMMAWALALTDEDLAEEELTRLAAHAEGLGIAPERAEELKRHAQLFVVDQALEAANASGQPGAEGKKQVAALAQKIGLDPEDAERAEVKYRKRMGV